LAQSGINVNDDDDNDDDDVNINVNNDDDILSIDHQRSLHLSTVGCQIRPFLSSFAMYFLAFVLCRCEAYFVKPWFVSSPKF